jgi:CheY-like chemotaxis protein
MDGERMERRPYAILVVNADLSALSSTVEMLRDAGYDVTGAATSAAARSLLAAGLYDLLVIDVPETRGEAPALARDLVQRVREERHQPKVIAIVKDPASGLGTESAAHGTRELRRPFDRETLLRLVEDLVATLRRPAGYVPVGVAESTARVVDVSYGGLRFEMRAPPRPLPPAFLVTLPGQKVSVQVEAVWTDRLSRPGVLCGGAALITNQMVAAEEWRRFVDGIRP